MLINYTNHPSSSWSNDQVKAAAAWGKIVDMPFAQVNPAWNRQEIQDLAEKELRRIMTSADSADVCVHVMGEMTLTYELVSLLKAKGIRCVASTAERIVRIDEEGNRVSTFRFVRFREY